MRRPKNTRCEHPDCTGRHDTGGPRAAICPAAYARKLELNRAMTIERDQHPHECRKRGCNLQVTPLFPSGTYPPFCLGHAYLQSRKHYRKIQVAKFGALIGIPGLTVEQAREMVMGHGNAA